MRNGQNKRMRGRNNQQQQQHHHQRKSQNPLTRVYESNGPEVKIRGTASTVAEKYLQLARDAQASGDPVTAENYYQHAEHYFRVIAAAQEQFRQANPYYQAETHGGARDDFVEEGEDQQPAQAGGGDLGSQQQPYPPREQPYPPRDGQPHYSNRDQQQHQHQPRHQQPQQAAPAENGGDPDRLPAFITGGQAPAPQQNGAEGANQGDRFPLHRRRRRHRGPRGDLPAGQSAAEDADERPAE